MKAREGNNKELKNEPTTTNVGRHIFGETHSQKIDQLRQLEPISMNDTYPLTALSHSQTISIAYFASDNNI